MFPRHSGASLPGGGAAVSAIVVFYRSESSIVGCLAALAEQTTPPSEVIVVCNSPVDRDLASRLEAAGARLVSQAENAGFAAGCNIGAQAATGTYLLFLNPDVRCRHDAIERLAAAAATKAVVGPAIRDERGNLERSVKSRSYVRWPVMVSRELMVGRWLRLGSPRPPTRRAPVDVLSGACLMMRRDVFDMLGGWDERFFLYGEDVDLCFRAASLGVDRIYEPAATVVHVSGTGGGGAQPDDEVLRIKGREARRAHALLIEKYRGAKARHGYVAAMGVVLRLRRSAAVISGRNPAEVVRADAAQQWLASEEATRASIGERHVAVVSNGAHATGAPLSLLALLERRPPDVRVHVASIGGGPLVDDFRRVADSLELLPAPQTRGFVPRRLFEELATLRSLWRWGRRRREAHLLVNTVEFESALFLARRRAGRAAVAIRENPTYLLGFRGRLRRALLRSSDVRLAGVGAGQANAWRQALGRRVEHLVNIYEAPARRPAPPPRRPVRFLFVGGRSPRKGLDLVTAAFDAAGLDAEAVLLVASGDFAPSEEGNVRYLGHVPDLAERVGEIAHFMVGGSRQEPFSRAVVEAAFAGVPTVAWATGGYVEQVEDLGGWLVEPFDVAKLASRLSELARMSDQDYELRSDAVRRNAERVFDADAAAGRWWQWVLDEPAGH